MWIRLFLYPAINTEYIDDNGVYSEILAVHTGCASRQCSRYNLNLTTSLPLFSCFSRSTVNPRNNHFNIEWRPENTLIEAFGSSFYLFGWASSGARAPELPRFFVSKTVAIQKSGEFACKAARTEEKEGASGMTGGIQDMIDER